MVVLLASIANLGMGRPSPITVSAVPLLKEVPLDYLTCISSLANIANWVPLVIMIVLGPVPGPLPGPLPEQVAKDIVRVISTTPSVPTHQQPVI